ANTLSQARQPWQRLQKKLARLHVEPECLRMRFCSSSSAVANPAGSRPWWTFQSASQRVNGDSRSFSNPSPTRVDTFRSVVCRWEVPAQVRFGEKVFVGGFDGLADADDV